MAQNYLELHLNKMAKIVPCEWHFEQLLDLTKEIRAPS